MSTALTSRESSTIKPTREFAVSLLRDEFHAAVEALPPEIIGLTQDQLEEQRKPTDIDYFLRKNLWNLVEKAQNGLIDEIQASEVYRGVCSRQAFSKVLTSPKRVAWLLTIPHTDQETLEAGLTIGLRNLLKFVSKEPTVETAGPFIKAIEFLYNRVHGPLVQKFEGRHAHLHAQAQQAQPAPQTPEEIAARISAMKAKLVGGS